jgi:cyanophycin synthetase
MRIDDVRRLRGPNVYRSHPVAVALVDLQELTGRETADVPGFTARLLELLPGLAEHRCAATQLGGLAGRVTRGTHFGHVLERVTLELSHLIGREVYFGRTLRAGAPGRFRLILECPDDEWAKDPVVEQLLALALRAVSETVEGRVPDLVTELRCITARYEESRLGVSTAELARAARERDIPVRRLLGLELLQLGYGCRRRLVRSITTEQTSTIGVHIARDKQVTKQLLAAAGIPVPEGTVVHSAAEAVDAFGHLGGPVVVKPVSGHHGRGVSVAFTAGEVIIAYGVARAVGRLVLVESYVAGSDYRVLVVGGRAAAAAELSPARVTGNGLCEIAALVDHVNSDPRRGIGCTRPLTRIVLDDASIAHLAGQGLAPASVPALGQIVTLRQNANLSTGGTSKDVTDSMHPAVARMCVRAAAVIGLDVCGIDLRLPDISQPPVAGPASGCVIEINASPGLRIHLYPSEGSPRDVAGDIVDQLYPPGAPSRVPIVSVTGTNGKTTTVRLIAHILRRSGLHVGMTSTDGVYIDGDRVHASDVTGAESADVVLGDPTVQAAVLETARCGVVGRDLGYDRADVAVVTNISNDHPGHDGTNTLDDSVTVESLVAEQIVYRGQLVLNADDRNSAVLAQRPAVRDRDPVIRYFSLFPANQAVTGHLRCGGIAYLLDAGWLVEAEGARHTALAHVHHLPQSWCGHAGFMVANVLAALAASRALGVRAEDLPGALASFPEPGTPLKGKIQLSRTAVVPAGRACCNVTRSGVASVTSAAPPSGHAVTFSYRLPAVAIIDLETAGPITTIEVPDSSGRPMRHFAVDLRQTGMRQCATIMTTSLADGRWGEAVPICKVMPPSLRKSSSRPAR